MVMGLDEDPEDHAAVASSIFITVAVYAVWHPCVICRMYTNVAIGLLPILWFSSVAESKTKQEGRHLATMKNAGIEYGKERMFYVASFRVRTVLQYHLRNKADQEHKIRFEL